MQRDATNSWKLYGVDIQVLLPRTHGVTRVVIESLGIKSLVGRAEQVYARCLRDTLCTIVQIPEGENMRLVSRRLVERLH